MKRKIVVNLDDHRKLPDIQSLPDNRQLAIQQVGITDFTGPMTFIDLDNERQHTIGLFSLHVSLEANCRGTHMSRLVEIINDYSFAISLENIHEILTDTKYRLFAQTASISIDFPYFLTKEAPMSGLPAPVRYGVKISGTNNPRNFTDLFLEVVVPVTTLCPCSREISARGAHNQRSQVSVKIKMGSYCSVKEIIKIVEESASCEIFGVLKREDEKFVTEKAFDNPRFVEDMVREVALRLQQVGIFNYFSVESKNFESIHNHSAYALIEVKR